jgi:hypothetical protein
LHVFISVVVMALLSRGVRQLSVFAVAFVLHAIHNATVHPLMPTDMQGLAISVFARCAIFVGLTVLVLRWSGRERAATEEALG